jgi:hypothetical protein
MTLAECDKIWPAYRASSRSLWLGYSRSTPAPVLIPVERKA